MRFVDSPWHGVRRSSGTVVKTPPRTCERSPRFTRPRLPAKNSLCVRSTGVTGILHSPSSAFVANRTVHAPGRVRAYSFSDFSLGIFVSNLQGYYTHAAARFDRRRRWPDVPAPKIGAPIRPETNDVNRYGNIRLGLFVRRLVFPSAPHQAGSAITLHRSRREIRSFFGSFIFYSTTILRSENRRNNDTNTDRTNASKIGIFPIVEPFWNDY